MGVQRGQRHSGHLPQLHRIGWRHGFADNDRFAFDNPAAATAFSPIWSTLINTDQGCRRSLRHQPQRRLLPATSSVRPDGAVPIRDVQPGNRSPTRPASTGGGDAAWRTHRQGQRDERNRRSRQCGIEKAGAAREVLAWLGSTQGNEFVGRHGAAIPANLPAQKVYFD